ncbi:MAG: hypothetical protein OWR62_03000 [Sulfobacillus thermotolerans]|uniref:Uncharacterized protein n=1 Tax=Sulfobacillus thermotolerans TaxID=338644 RepID=A0ABM6RPL7_9FIRM|nr:hypothetical protein BXT84_04590 [Sulfobacillus thermotolerans]MCY0907338.1 hypothetical protein [Sulfobacillus thermotolerans]
MRAKFFAIIMMAIVASFAWVRYHDPLHFAPKPNISVSVSAKKLGHLPTIAFPELENMIKQGMVYGVNLRTGSSIALFLARTPNNPANLEIMHWPPQRFAAIAVIAHPTQKFGTHWRQTEHQIHWLHIAPDLAQ